MRAAKVDLPLPLWPTIEITSGSEPSTVRLSGCSAGSPAGRRRPACRTWRSVEVQERHVYLLRRSRRAGRPRRLVLGQRRHALDQVAGVGVLRRLEQALDRPPLDHLPLAHHDQLVDELRHQSHVVADQHQPGAASLLHVLERLHDQPLSHHVEGAGRLVGDQQLRVEADGDGDAGALLHPARQLMRETSARCRAEDPPAPEARRSAARAQPHRAPRHGRSSRRGCDRRCASRG